MLMMQFWHLLFRVLLFLLLCSPSSSTGNCSVASDSCFAEMPLYERLIDEEYEQDEEDERATQPAQMTQDWWELHYSTMLQKEGRKVTGDPRHTGNTETGELFGNDLNDHRHAKVALENAREALLTASQSLLKSGDNRSLEVLVIGCGLSPLAFALADEAHKHAVSWRVRCLEISGVLIGTLRMAAERVPLPPSFVAGDVTAASRRRRSQYRRHSATATSFALAPASIDIAIDENVLDGMACTFPASHGRRQQGLAVDGMKWLLRPGGLLLTLSFLPLEEPYLAAPDLPPGYVGPLGNWKQMELRWHVTKSATAELLHPALWERPPGDVDA